MPCCLQQLHCPSLLAVRFPSGVADMFARDLHATKVILMAKMVKVPLYTVVNIALTFAITFPFSGLLHAISFDYLLCGSAKCGCCCRRFCCCCCRAVAKDSNALAADEINRRPNSQQTCTMFTASVVLGLSVHILFRVQQFFPCWRRVSACTMNGVNVCSGTMVSCSDCWTLKMRSLLLEKGKLSKRLLL